MDCGVTFLVEKVSEMILYYGADLEAGAEDELKELERDLLSVKSILVESGYKSRLGPTLKRLDNEMRELVYEVEDMLDACLTEAAAPIGAINKLKQHRSHRVGMAERIKSLREHNVKVMIQKATTVLTVGSRLGDQQSWDVVKKDQSISIWQDKLVGLDDEAEKINGYLMEETNELDVISIVGLPGMGKSALAWKIFDSEKMRFEYRVRIWFDVSRRLNKKDLCLTILRRFTSEGISNLSDHELEQKVHGYLQQEKFLIVLDDVWTVDDWTAIRDALLMQSGRGKVIITSRSLQVGRFAGPRGPCLLRFLTDDESWAILQLKVFGDVGVCPQSLQGIGKQIASTCGGMLLVIHMIGGILLAQYTRIRSPTQIEKEWVKVHEDLEHFIRTDESDGLLNVLALSYDMLPDELRECFVYLGVFPENYEIPAWTLIRLWIAEGFITNKENRSLEETADLYLNDLVNRNLVMVGRTTPTGEIKTCRVHDVIRAFCLSKADEVNLFQVIQESHEGLDVPDIRMHGRRLCIDSGLSTFLSKNPSGPTIQSVLYFNKDPEELHPQYNVAIPDAFKRLRVLGSIKFQRFPPMLITDLMHLRYITIYVHHLKILPEPIARLWNLQTLVVGTGSHMLVMNANMWRMFRLRHLKTNAALVLDHNWEGQGGHNLQTLSNLSSESCTKSVSKRAINLKELGIVGNLATLLDSEFLEGLHCLERLKLVNDLKYYESVNREQHLFRIPPSDCFFPPNLKRLTLKKTSLDWSDMSKLAEIKSLEVLKLKQNAFNGTTWKVVGDGFPCLQLLLISNTNLVTWEASADYFPALKTLSLNKCEKLAQIPMEVARNLLRLDLAFVSLSATESAMNIEEHKLKDGVRFQLNIGSARIR